MSLSCALLALTLFNVQGTDQGGAFLFEGKPVPMRLVSRPAPQPGADLLGWDGWQYLSGAPKEAFAPYQVAANWQNISELWNSQKAAAGVPWRAKIFILLRTELAGRDPGGVLRVDRNTLYDKQFAETMEAIGRVKAWIKADTNGKVDFLPDVEVEDDFIRATDLGASFAQWYVGPRINGGLYEAEDKVYRGPFNSAFYIAPGFTSEDPVSTIVNGTPVSGIFTDVLGVAPDSGRLELALYKAFRSQVAERLRMQGFRGTGEAPADLWAAAASTDEPSTDVFVARLNEGRGASLPAPKAEAPTALWWTAPGTDVSLADDPERGKVLRVKEQVYYRMGGVGLPNSGGIAIDASPTLSLYAKTTDSDPISIRFQGKSSAFWVSLGRDPRPLKPSKAVVASVPFEDDGQWHKVSVDLRPYAKEAGVTEIIGMAIEPSPNALLADVAEYGSSEYLFDDIKLSTEEPGPVLQAPKPDFGSKDPEERALAAAQAQSSSDLMLAALADPSPLVRLNATALYTIVKDPRAEPLLIKNIGDLLAPVQEQAVLAVANQGSEAAITALRNTIKFTIGDLAKATASRALANTGDVKYTGDLLLLLMQSNWQTAIATVESVAKLNPELPQARHVFLRSLVPAVRFRTVELLDMASAGDRSAAQWHAVNDPSDMVRAAAYVKLVNSGDKALIEEGYKGVRDDSRFTRVLVLNALAANPKPEHRGAIDVALTDRSATVRVAAINALKALPGEPTKDELDLIGADQHPDVRAAAAALLKRNSR
jgi:HEAT repeat protein